MTNAMCRDVAQTTVKAAAGRLKVAVQVTDNSAERILDNIALYADSGIDAVVVAPPYFQLNASQDYLKNMFLEVLDKSPLPVGFYHRGQHASVEVSAETVMSLMAHPNLIMVKDSSGDKTTMTQFVAHSRTLDNPPLLLDGDEFDCVPYLQAGYDGVLFGGGCFNGFMANRIVGAGTEGDFAAAQQWQERMNAMMMEFFGGQGFPCWLAGQKQVLVELGVFSTNKTILDYDLTPACHQAIKVAIDREHEFLLP
jgi:4-hydroxy-tetrahydrodipicolinate synthase